MSSLRLSRGLKALLMAPLALTALLAPGTSARADDQGYVLGQLMQNGGAPGTCGQSGTCTIAGDNGNPDCPITIRNPFEATDSTGADKMWGHALINCQAGISWIDLRAELHHAWCDTCSGTQLGNDERYGTQSVGVLAPAPRQGGGYWRTIVTVYVVYNSLRHSTPPNCSDAGYYAINCAFISYLVPEPTN